MRRRGKAVAAGVACACVAAIGLGGCGDGEGDGSEDRDELLSRLADPAPLSRVYANFDALRSELELPADADPSDYRQHAEFATIASPVIVRLDAGTHNALALSQAHAGATSSYGKSVISTSADLDIVDSDLRARGWREAENGALTRDGQAIALDGGTIGIAESASDAAALVGDPAGEVPEPLSDVEGSFVTLTEYDSRSDCRRYVLSSDRPGAAGELRFFPVGEPDAAAVRTPEGDVPGDPLADDDSVRLQLDPEGPLDAVQLPAYDALRALLLDYVCDDS